MSAFALPQVFWLSDRVEVRLFVASSFRTLTIRRRIDQVVRTFDFEGRNVGMGPHVGAWVDHVDQYVLFLYSLTFHIVYRLLRLQIARSVGSATNTGTGQILVERIRSSGLVYLCSRSGRASTSPFIWCQQIY